MTVRNTPVGGLSGGICTALGIAIERAIWAIATSIGRIIEGLSGAILMSLGLRIATENR